MSHRNTLGASHVPVVDGLKALAMQAILFHHMAAYGPLAEAAQDFFPGLAAWFYDYGRMAVQVFLVVGGYLAARSLESGFLGKGRRPALHWVFVTVRRYLRLALPFLAALLLAILCAALARRWMIDADFIPAAPTLDQIAAHGLMLHSLLDYEAISAGAWYVAIDFQLFVLLAVLLLLGERGARWSPRLRHLGVLLVTTATLASLFHFNRDSTFDNWALYFFGSYGLGVLAYWAGRRQRAASHALVLVLLLLPAALLVDFRWRTLIAFATVFVLLFSSRLPALSTFCRAHIVRHFGQTSYALFLTHFPLYMLFSAVCIRLGLLDGDFAERNALLALATLWASSLYAAALFHRWIELPCNRLRFAWLAASSPAREFDRRGWQSV